MDMVLALIPTKDFVFWYNIIIFAADIRSPVHIDNRNEETLILGKIPTDGLDDSILTAKKNIQKILLSSRINFV